MTETITDAIAADSSVSMGEASTAMSRFFNSLTAEKIISALVLIVLCAVCIKLLMVFGKKLLNRLPIEKHMHNSILSLLRFILVFIAILLTTGTLGIDTSSLLTVLGVAALAVSLSVQNSLSNVTAAITIFISKPIHIGDYIRTGDYFGRVDTIGLIYTRILTLEGHFVSIPNSTVASGAISNYTVNGNCCIEIKVGVDYHFSPAEVKAALLRAADDPQIVATAPPEAFLFSYETNDMMYILRVFTTQEHYRAARFLLMERVKACLDEKQITIAYPHMVIHNAQ